MYATSAARSSSGDSVTFSRPRPARTRNVTGYLSKPSAPRSAPWACVVTMLSANPSIVAGSPSERYGAVVPRPRQVFVIEAKRLRLAGWRRPST